MTPRIPTLVHRSNGDWVLITNGWAVEVYPAPGRRERPAFDAESWTAVDW